MDTPDSSLAPGCVGSPLIYSVTNSICCACMFVNACAPEATQRLAALHSHFGITPRKKKEKKIAVQPVPEPVILVDREAVEKAHAFEKTMHRKGLPILLSLIKGRNPVPKPVAGSNAHMDFWLACEYLRRGVAVTLDALSYTYVSRLHWSKEYAVAQASKTLNALVAMGVVNVTDGSYTLKRT